MEDNWFITRVLDYNCSTAVGYAHILYAIPVWLPASADPVSVKMQLGASSAENGGSATTQQNRVSVFDPSKPATLLFGIQIRVGAFTDSQILASIPLVDFQSNTKRQPKKLQRLAAYLVVNDTSIWCWRRAVRRLDTSDWHCCPRWPWHPWICWRSWRGLEREKANQDWSFQLN